MTGFARVGLTVTVLAFVAGGVRFLVVGLDTYSDLEGKPKTKVIDSSGRLRFPVIEVDGERYVCSGSSGGFPWEEARYDPDNPDRCREAQIVGVMDVRNWGETGIGVFLLLVAAYLPFHGVDDRPKAVKLVLRWGPLVAVAALAAFAVRMLVNGLDTYDDLADKPTAKIIGSYGNSGRPMIEVEGERYVCSGRVTGYPDQQARYDPQNPSRCREAEAVGEMHHTNWSNTRTGFFLLVGSIYLLFHALEPFTRKKKRKG